MIIDFHTHTFPDKIADMAVKKLKEDAGSDNFSDGTYGGLLESMKKNGIDKSIILPVVTNPVKASRMNQGAYEVNQKFEETGIFSFGGIHPDTPDYKTVLKEAADLGLKGIKLHPDYYGIGFNDIRVKRIVESATENDLIVITHAGQDIGLYPPTCCTPDMIVELYKEVQPEKLVLAHMGGWQLWDEVMEKIYPLENVWLDTAFSIGEIKWVKENKHGFRLLTENEFIEMIKLFGSERIIFATDSPWYDQGEARKIIENLPISDLEKENIFHATAEKLLGWV